MLNRLKGILYDCIGLLACSGTRPPSVPKLLIVKTDEIGDCMLWHNFLQELVSAEQFKGYEIHFCGNSSWESLFETFDSGLVQQSFWLQKVRFKKDMRYRLGFLTNIYRQHYTCVINPTFSRDKRNDDAIVKAARSPRNIGMVANLESVRSYERGYDKGLYTQLFDYLEKPVFEFTRNRLFTEFVTGRKSLVQDTKIDANKLPSLPAGLPEKYFVVFPGSRTKARIWPAEYFATVSKHLFEQYGWTAVVCGGPDDAEYADAFTAAYKNPLVNITGKTSLPQLMTVLKNAQCLLSVDTGSVHLAAATGCTVFGIYNGSQYGRFAPYPASMAPNFYPVYPDNVEAELADASLVKQKYEFVVDVPYSAVTPEKIIKQTDLHFNR
jgi:ADP-heptose:LPS heptosyltransferase